MREVKNETVNEKGEALRSADLAFVYVASWIAAIAIGTHGLAYWDAGDYVREALRGEASGLLLGRPLFLWISRAVAAIAIHFGAGADAIEPTLRWTWTFVGCTAAPLLSVVAARAQLGRRAAILAGLCLAVSPSFAHTAHQVLTDAPALALSLAAIAVALSAASYPRAAIAGVFVAFAVATRETAGVQLVAVAWLLARRRRSLAIAAVASFALTIAIIVFVSHPEGVRAWLSAMHRSSKTNPLGLRDIALSLAWLFAVGPLAVVVALVSLVRRDARSRDVRAIAYPSLVASALLLFYPDVSFSPRYLLATAPIAFFLIAAPRLSRAIDGASKQLSRIALLLPLALSPLATRGADAIANNARDLAKRLDRIPDRAVLVPGHGCPAVGAAIAAREAVRAQRTGKGLADPFMLVCPGWGWPDDLAKTLDRARCEDRPIALDLDDAAWIGPREVGPRNEVRAYVEKEPIGVLDGWVIVGTLPVEDTRCAGAVGPR